MQEKNIHHPRIFFIHGSCSQITRRDGQEQLPVVDSYDAFAFDAECSKYMSDCYFPSYLRMESWCKSSGFAGSKKVKNANIAWFRILIKIVPDIDDHYWHEMTFLVHQSCDGFVTVFCFDVPDDVKPVPRHPSPSSSVLGEQISHVGEKDYDFVTELYSALLAEPQNFIPDWRFMQDLLLRHAAIAVDSGIWYCNRAVWKVEKLLRKQTEGPKFAGFDFLKAHDVLRHILQNAEVLKAATDVFSPWLERYKADQIHQARSKGNRARLLCAHQGQNRQSSQTQDQFDTDIGDETLPEESRYDSLLASMQLIASNAARNAAMESRLRNEIVLAFNRAAQQEARTMRIISIVTLLFPPATFVSTLFSMSFFNFHGPNDPVPIWFVTSEVWTSAAVAGPLTAFAMACLFGPHIKEFAAIWCRKTQFKPQTTESWFSMQRERHNTMNDLT